MIVAERPPYPMFFVGGIGVIALLSGIGTLAHSFSLLLGSTLLAYGIAILLDTFALGYTWWAVDSVMQNRPHRKASTAAHLCVALSVAVQVVTSITEVHGVAGWTLALVRILAPLSLCLVLVMAESHYADLHRDRMAPRRVIEVLREQAARGVTGLPVDPRQCANAVVAAAKADLISIEALVARVDPAEIEKVPALAALYDVVCTTPDASQSPARGSVQPRPQPQPQPLAPVAAPVRSIVRPNVPNSPNTRPAVREPNTALLPNTPPNTEHPEGVRSANAEHLPNTPTVREPNTEQPEGVRPNVTVFASLSDHEKAERVSALRERGLGVRAIATEVGCSSSTASAWVKRLSNSSATDSTRTVGFTPNGGDPR